MEKPDDNIELSSFGAMDGAGRTEPARILIVEDESLVAVDLEQRLCLLGYSPVGIVDTGEDAVTRATELRPELVLMDVRLKGAVDGIEAAGRLRVPHRIPVVFLTSHSDRGTLERAGLAEPFGYLTKPFQERDLHATIEMALYRHRAEERLHKLECWLATTLSSIADAVIATDTSGQVTYLNRAAELLTGWTMREARGQPWNLIYRITHAATGAPITDLLLRLFREGVVNLNANATLTTRAGRSVPVDDSVAPLRNDGGQVTGCVIVFRDATERRAMEYAILNHNEQLSRSVAERTAELRSANQELEQSNEQLRAANKELEAISYSISHDLRSPLRAICGFTGLLKERHEKTLDEGGRRLLNVITGSATKMAEMIDGFLALIRLGRSGINSEAVDLSALVLGLLDEFRAAHPGSKVQFEVRPLPTAIGDRVLLRQVWANLLENAVKFTAKRGEPIIIISGRETEGECVYSLQDNGEGFDNRYAHKLFGIFQRLHAEGEFPGHGIGLANVQRIVSLHGGRVWAEGEPNRGATFHFSLPGWLGSDASTVKR